MWPFTRQQKAATSQPNTTGGWRRVLEPFAGAFQLGQHLDQHDLTAYPAVSACLARISDDVAGLPFKAVKEDSHGVARPVPLPAVLQRPNSYQSPSQFRRAWILSKLMHGNTAVLLNGDEAYILDWQRVTPLVSESGGVFYQIATSNNDLLPEHYHGQTVRVPASAIIHDRGPCLHSQLVGSAPLAAAYLPAAKNYAILDNGRQLFEKGNQLGGLLSVPAGMSETDAKELRCYWEKTEPSDVRVLGMDAKFQSFSQTSEQAQLAQQLQLSDRQIATAFGVPPYLIGAADYPSGLKPEQLLRLYHQTTLRSYLSQMEELLSVATGAQIQLDTSALLRLDAAARAEMYRGLLMDGVITTNEARAKFDYAPVSNGDSILRQMQDVEL